MRRPILILFYIIISISIFGQTKFEYLEGNVSFISSQNIYTKFSSTKDIKVGDTLYFVNNGSFQPRLIVSSLSSISCICNSISEVTINVNDKVYFKSIKKGKDKESAAATILLQDSIIPISLEDSIKQNRRKVPSIENYSGKIGISSFSGFSNNGMEDFLRMRYVVSLKADHYKKSKFSAETYIAFTHKQDQWEEIKKNIFVGLKIYNLSIKYDYSDNTSMVLGRKFNRYIANIGAIDGFQIQHKMGRFTIGGIAGSKPDPINYGFNPSLIQVGAFASHAGKIDNKMYQSSIALMQQFNGSKTDRRFLYFQHNNTLAKNLYSFASFELDLYKVVNEKPTSTIDLTSLYFMLRYNLSKKITLSGSYDLRNNVIYYETYKSYLDRLIEQETRQGITASMNYRIFKWMQIRAQGSYRYRKDDASPSKNAGLNFYFPKTPVERLSFNLSSNYIQASYIRGSINAARFSYDLIPGKLYGSYQYRFFFGRYNFSEKIGRAHV